MNLQIARPRPPPDRSWPPEYDVYSSKIFSRFSIGTPGPESHISIRNELGACKRDARRSPVVISVVFNCARRSQKKGYPLTSIDPYLGVNLHALSRRLTSTCSICSGSKYSAWLEGIICRLN